MPGHWRTESMSAEHICACAWSWVSSVKCVYCICVWRPFASVPIGSVSLQVSRCCGVSGPAEWYWLRLEAYIDSPAWAMQIYSAAWHVPGLRCSAPPVAASRFSEAPSSPNFPLPTSIRFGTRGEERVSRWSTIHNLCNISIPTVPPGAALP